MNTTYCTTKININNSEHRQYMGMKNGRKIYLSISGMVRCYTMEDMNGHVVDTIDLTRNEQIPARFIPEK